MGEGMRPTRQQQCQRDKSQAETNKPVTGVAKEHLEAAKIQDGYIFVTQCLWGFHQQQ